MEKKIINRIVTLNLILISFLILDHVLPCKESKIEELSSIYGYTSISGSSRKPKMDTKSILELNNGERFRIGKFPEKEYSKGQKIVITKSFFSSNINKVKILDKDWETLNVGLFSNFIILFVFIAVFVITILNLFINNKLVNVLLVFSMMFLSILFLIYNFYF